MTRLQQIRQFLVKVRVLPRDDRPAFGKYLLKHIPVVVIIFLLTLLAESSGFFRRYETFALDAILNLHTPPSTATIFLVVIDDHDYETLFHGVSPLDPREVHAALKDIQRGRPAVVAVDLETSNPVYSQLEWPDAVWVRSATPVIEESATELEQLHSAHALEAIQRGRFLGGQGREEPPNKAGILETIPRSGPSLFLADSDGVIRRYRDLYYSPSADPPSENKGYVESFPWVISRAYADHLRATGHRDSDVCRRIEDKEHHNVSERTEEIGLTFGGSRDRFRQISLGNLRKAASQPYWETNSPLKDAIVLFGGTYSAGRDVYVTPVGPRYGIELVAHAVETTLANGGIHEVNHHLAHVLDIVVGLVILVILWRFPGHHAFIATLLVAAALALAASYLAFSSLAYWFNFVPMVGGLWLHFQWEKRKEQQELLHELKSLREARSTNAAQGVTAK